MSVVNSHISTVFNINGMGWNGYGRQNQNDTQKKDSETNFSIQDSIQLAIRLAIRLQERWRL